MARSPRRRIAEQPAVEPVEPAAEAVSADMHSTPVKITVGAAMLGKLAREKSLLVDGVLLVAGDDFPPYWRVR